MKGGSIMYNQNGRSKVDNTGEQLDKIDEVVPADYLTDSLYQQINDWYVSEGLEARFGPLKKIPFQVFIDLFSSTDLKKFFPVGPLSVKRQVEILRQRQKYAQLCVKYSKRFYSKLISKYKKSLEKEDLRRPAWYEIGPSRSGYRLVIGLAGRGCTYRRENPIGGCNFCGLNAGSSRDANADDLYEQFKNALKTPEISDHPMRSYVSMIEFLNDGSWFQDQEVPPRAREQILWDVSNMSNIGLVVVESRPEYITQKKVEKALLDINFHQKLSIAIGIESENAFINLFCNNKGNTIDKFEHVLQFLQPYQNRIGVIAYNLFKPAFLTEREALEDSLNLARTLDGLQKKYGVDIEMKVEPTVVAKGTLIALLHKDGTYTPPSYWTIAELIAKICEANLSINLRIGGRDDMDEFLDVAGIYAESRMFALIDFLVYDSVQRFNRHQDLVEFLTDIEVAEGDPSFRIWQEKNNFTTTALLTLTNKYAEEIEQKKADRNFRKRRKFLKKCYAALDEIEYEMQDFALTVADKLDDVATHDIIKSIVRNIFVKRGIRVISVHRISILPNKLGLLRMEFTVIDKDIGEPLIGWLGIPTKKRIPLPNTSVIEYL